MTPEPVTVDGIASFLAHLRAGGLDTASVEDVSARLQRAAASGGVVPVQTPECPTLARFLASMESEWTDAERAHVAQCLFCQFRLAGRWATRCPPWYVIGRYAENPALEPDRVAVAIHLGSHACPACNATMIEYAHTHVQSKPVDSPRRFALATWALPAAASFLIGAVLGTAVMRRTQPATLDAVEVSKALTSAPVVTLQRQLTREAGAAPVRVLAVTFSRTDTFVRVVVPVDPDPLVPLTTFEVTLKRDGVVVWQALTPISYGDGRGAAVALLPVSLLGPGADIRLAVGEPGLPSPEWQIRPNAK